ncbi:hypothetical protein Acr_00g0064020 [Actinidia rufa]|uniref:Uncharacterized protein n=1 Tax=Actinidia rufa TaxID=165716 RepID=A0A7J0DQT7_9ERIC|nr:hypothetical protein Acr_00g0064020 [Actinidia rufa]
MNASVKAKNASYATCRLEKLTQAAAVAVPVAIAAMPVPQGTGSPSNLVKEQSISSNERLKKENMQLNMELG